VLDPVTTAVSPSSLPVMGGRSRPVGLVLSPAGSAVSRCAAPNCDSRRDRGGRSAGPPGRGEPSAVLYPNTSATSRNRST
jgi:hypothetical protein